MADGPHWTETLFLQHADLWIAVHEHAFHFGKDQAQDIHALLEEFRLEPGARILDAPCGIGRHIIHLAKVGYEGVGVDFSPTFVERAKELANGSGVSKHVKFLPGDLRRLEDAIPEEERPFDIAMNLWTSLGYYDRATDVRILEQYADLVRLGGLLLLYIVNRDFIVRHFDPQGYETFGDVVHIEQRRLDLDSSRMRNEWRFFRRQGRNLQHAVTIPIDHRVYSLHELRALLGEGGWRVEAAYGGLKRDEPSVDSPALLVVGRR